MLLFSKKNSGFFQNFGLHETGNSPGPSGSREEGESDPALPLCREALRKDSHTSLPTPLEVGFGHLFGFFFAEGSVEIFLVPRIDLKNPPTQEWVQPGWGGGAF